MGYKQSKPTDLYVDNKGAIDMSRDYISNERTKHIERRHLKVRELVEDAVINVKYIATHLNVADIFTKPLEPARFFTLRNANGMSVELMEFGATVTRVVVPDRDGRPVDVVLGFDTVEEYPEKSQYFGCTVGRVGNRIAGGSFELDGRTHQLATNNGPNHLHGGDRGFDRSSKRNGPSLSELEKQTTSMPSTPWNPPYPRGLNATLLADAPW